MRLRNKPSRRQGTILLFMAVVIIVLMGVLALSIDIGMIAVARTQAQNAADASAMAGARTVNGDETANYNISSAPGKAIEAAVKNYILAKHIEGDPNNVVDLGNDTFQSGEVKVYVGAYTYHYDDFDPSVEGFKIQFPRSDSSEPYSAVRSTISSTRSSVFAKLLGASTFNAVASATAVHRPRDVIIVMDLSGSMRFQSLPGTPVNPSSGYASPSSSSRPRTVSLNPETVFPRFGHYSNESAAGLFGNTVYTTGEEGVDPANLSAWSNSGPPLIDDFFGNAVGTAPAAGNKAFARAPDAQENDPVGDNFLLTSKNTGANYAKNVAEITGTAVDDKLDFENNGYKAYVADFEGYTEGPGYWGKTFMIWPPDPGGSTLDPNNSANHANNGAKDWRQRFFFKVRTSNGSLGWLDHNNILFNPTGNTATWSNRYPTPYMKTPGMNTTVQEDGNNVTYRYRINYAAIFHWLRNETPIHFPSTLQAGRIRYYTEIPDPTGDANFNSRFWTQYPLTDKSERFWKDYVDFVLGLAGTGANQYRNQNTRTNGSALTSVPLSAMIGNGDYFQWGTMQIMQKPDIQPNDQTEVNFADGYSAGHTGEIEVYTSPLAANFLVNEFVRFDGDPTTYRITNVYTDGSGNTNRFKLHIPLVKALSHQTDVDIYNSNNMPVFMSHTDNIPRAKHQFWFGPMTFVDYLGNYNTQRFWWPGNVHEAQAWAAKVGIQTAIDDIKKNHPSDFIGLSFFSSPKNYASDSGQHNTAVVPLGRKYQQLKDSLWFPPTTVVGGVNEITPYDTDFDQVPRAKGGTAPQMGFMIAYNLLSSSINNLRFYAEPTNIYRGNAGGLGRKGATRMIIFETDGAPNTRAYAEIEADGSNSYYPIRIKNPANQGASVNVEWPDSGSFAKSHVYAVVAQMAKNVNDPVPGYSTNRKPCEVHCIGYGTLFDPANSGTAGQSSALEFLQSIQHTAQPTIFPSTSGNNFDNWRRVFGTNDERINRMQKAFSNIMQAGVQVSLIE